jgi:Peptidase C80 family
MYTNYIWNAQPSNSITQQGVTKLVAKIRKHQGATNVLLEDLSPPTPIDKSDKLTILGHGTPNANLGAQMLGGHFPPTLARKILSSGFRTISKIVLLMCGDNFASGTKAFADVMKERGYKGTIIGYTASMTLNKDGKREAIEDELDDATWAIMKEMLNDPNYPKGRLVPGKSHRVKIECG